MNTDTLLRRVAKAYRPLYLNGLLLDGQYRLPAARAPGDPPPASRTPSRARMLLAALTGLRHGLFHDGSKR